MQFLVQRAFPPRQGDVPFIYKLLELEDAPPPLVFEQRFPFSSILEVRVERGLERALVLRAELELVLRIPREGLGTERTSGEEQRSDERRKTA